MSNDPRYPIGRFSAPDMPDELKVAGWRRDIVAAPAELRAAVSGLGDVQLDTPYRDGGWTVRQVVHHLADSHLNAYCRFKLALTEDNPVIKPYLEARWAELPDGRTPPVDPSLALLEGLHQRWGALLESLTTTDFDRTFVHPEQKVPTQLWRSLGIYSWHGKHHTAQVLALRTRLGW